MMEPGQLKAVAAYIIVALAALSIKVLFFNTVSFAQATAQPVTPSVILSCLDKTSVQNMIYALQTIVLVAIILIVIFILVFNSIGFVSTLAMRLGEFFMERIRFVFELLIIFVLFLWNLDPGTMIGQDTGGCATVDWQALFSSGPLFFKFVGMILSALGLWQPRA